jgi:COP9 signalosome complex subunit 1
MLLRGWVDGVDARAASTQYRLETELSGYKTNLIKESIRMGHHELADFFYERGDLQVWCLCIASYALHPVPAL